MQGQALAIINEIMRAVSRQREYTQVTQLTIYFDSHCPLCMKEMQQLKVADKTGSIVFADLHAEGFSQRHPHIDPQQAYELLHVETYRGELLTGLDANCAVWQAVGRKRWFKILRWPIIRGFADIAYRFFARHRETISRLVTGKARCDSCSINVERELNERKQQNTI